MRGRTVGEIRTLRTYFDNARLVTLSQARNRHNNLGAMRLPGELQADSRRSSSEATRPSEAVQGAQPRIRLSSRDMMANPTHARGVPDRTRLSLRCCENQASHPMVAAAPHTPAKRETINRAAACRPSMAG